MHSSRTEGAHAAAFLLLGVFHFPLKWLKNQKHMKSTLIIEIKQ